MNRASVSLESSHSDPGSQAQWTVIKSSTDTVSSCLWWLTLLSGGTTALNHYWRQSVARSFKDRNKYNVKAGESCQAYTGAGKDKFIEYWSPEQYQQVKMARKSQEIK